MFLNRCIPFCCNSCYFAVVYYNTGAGGGGGGGESPSPSPAEGPLPEGPLPEGPLPEGPLPGGPLSEGPLWYVVVSHPSCN